MQRHLIIFAKNPRIGRVKTRLARDIGKVAAWRFYRRMLQEVPRRLARDKRWTTWLCISPDATPWRCFPYRRLRRLEQGSGDLGARMWRPRFNLPPGPFVVIGTDIPDIQPAHIEDAFRQLGHQDVVFGPAEDGGFWLVGLKRHGRFVHPYRKPVRWSHPETLRDCLDNLGTAKVGFLEELDDIDTLQDLRRWRENA